MTRAPARVAMAPVPSVEPSSTTTHLVHQGDATAPGGQVR